MIRLFRTLSIVFCLCLAAACDLHDKIVGGERYHRPVPVADASEYGNEISSDDYVRIEDRGDYLQAENAADYSAPAAHPQDSGQKTAGKERLADVKQNEYENVKNAKEKTAGLENIKDEKDDPLSSILQSSRIKEPDDVLLVPARVAAPDPKPMLVAPAVGEIVVEKGDTVYSLSKKHGAPLRDFIDENKLSAPYSISIGQKLRVPAGRVHAVSAGETLYSISRRYSVDLNSLASENNLSAPYALAVGQRLKLPAKVVASSDTAAPGSQTPAQVAKQDKTAAAKELEKLNAEKKKIDAEKQRLAAEKKKIEEEKAKAVGAQKKAEAEKKRQEAEKQNLALEKRAKRNAAKIVEQKEKISSAPAKPLTAVAAQKKMKFVWPVRGKILSAFGYKNNGLYNDGINIGAAVGTAVKASEKGAVAYAGNELKGMGNLIIIQHANGWMTVYSHLDIMNVQRGDKVAAGEKIGTVGKTGKVSEPQLHFEIRKGTKAYNPQKELK
jgi:murein DD-endopeptidase MepM/ murein hydrolase activator NlpD